VSSRRAPARPLEEALADPACYADATAPIRVVETHISWVFLTGRYAYKVKKPVKLPFLDFSTLRRRRHFCREELRLNRRLAPELYLAVVPIGGSSAAPRVGERPAFEYAVKMREFDAAARLDRRLAANAVPRSAVAEFAARLAAFHAGLPRLAAPSPGAELAAALENFEELRVTLPARFAQPLDELRAWTQRDGHALRGVFPARARSGAYRECHGDLHLENLLWHAGAIVAFDCLEFDARLREIDVISEVAFLAMDFIAHGRTDLAYVFVNCYLEASGDYAGLDVLRFYSVYRALVRAKVHALAKAQAHAALAPDRHLETAIALSRPARPLLLITHGLSGSGKTTVTEALVDALPALRVRSDIERKRLLGLAASARTRSAVGQGAYAPNMSRRTYETLGQAADRALRHGFNAIVDAAFLSRAERWTFRQIAAANGARFAILDCTTRVTELRRRIQARAALGRDASEATTAVLDRQLIEREPLDAAERRAAVRLDTGRRVSAASLVRKLATR
jgi:uncharacterized protein